MNKNTATSGKLIKAVCSSCVYVYIFRHTDVCPCNMQESYYSLTLQRGGFKHPVHTVVWEGFSSGHLNLERSAASSARHSTTGGDFATRAALVTPR
jgi:hypothetical protein